MTIEEAEAAVRAAEKALVTARAEAENMLAAPRQHVKDAKAALLAALVEASRVKAGDVMEYRRWKKTDRIKVTGFRHFYGRELCVIASPLKKDGTPSVVSREYCDLDRLTKVEP